MKKMLPEPELARDERFVRTKIDDRIFDPRGPKVAQRNTSIFRVCFRCRRLTSTCQRLAYSRANARAE